MALRAADPDLHCSKRFANCQMVLEFERVRCGRCEYSHWLRHLDTRDRRAGFVRVTAGRLRVAQYAHPQAKFKPRWRATRPMRQSVSACKLGEERDGAPD